MLSRLSQFSRTSFASLVTTASKASSAFTSILSSTSTQSPYTTYSKLGAQIQIREIPKKTPMTDAPFARTPFTPEKQKKTVVIIGGRSQVGETLRRRYLASGWNVVCTTQGSTSHKLDDRGFHMEGDVNLGDEKAWTQKYWKKLFTKINTEQGPIHTVVNCAGISINDPNTGYKMDDVNRKPVAPMLEACIALGIDRYTFISTQAAKYPEARKPASYSKSKYDAEQDMIKIMASRSSSKTQTTILRPDLIISADNPGHFGSPQRMSTIPFIKLTVGHDPRKAGSTILQPAAAYDVADAVVNISDYNIHTPGPIDACGPEAHSIEDLMSFFKARQHKRFVMGVKIPTAAVVAAATIRPWGAFEQDHLDLIEHHEKHQVGKVDTSEFERIVGLSRPETTSPLLTLKEAFDFTKRPVFGTHDLGLYSMSLFKQIKTQDILPLCKGVGIGLTQSRIDFKPNKKTNDRSSNDGINTSVLLLGALGTGLAVHLYNNDEEDKKKSSKTTSTAEEVVTETESRRMRDCK
jgi:nucleoside-diphosphate-sugar epimerase